MAIPVIHALRGYFPNAKIHYLVNDKVYDLISRHVDSNICKVYPIKKVTVNTIRSFCLQNDYDMAIAVYPSFKIAMGLYLSNIKYRLGTAYRWYSFLFNIRHREHRKYSIKHEAVYNLGLLESLGYKVDNIPEISFSYKKEDLRNLMLRYNWGIKYGDKYIIIHVPSRGSAEVWSDENFTRLIELILKDEDLESKIFLSGSQEDVPKLSSLMKSINQDKKVITVSDLNLNDFGLLISGAELLISNSTGPIHIGAATGTFVIGLYPHIRSQNPVRWGPLTEKKKIFISDEKYTGRNIMDSINPEQVFEFIKLFYNKK